MADRVHQLWITPHGVIKGRDQEQRHPAVADQDGKSLAAVSFTEPGRFAATAFINDDYLVERVESRLPDPVLGEAAVTVYSDYRDFGGVKFPARIQQSQGGHPCSTSTVKEVQPNAPADIPVPDAVRNAAERVTTDKVAEGVWFVAGGSHNSVAIEMKDHLVLVEAPLNDGRSGPVIEQVKKLAPGKPIRYVINSHDHFDHSGGLRTAVAEGATIVTQAENKPYFERAFAVPNRINPDRLAKSGKKPSVQDGERQAGTERRHALARAPSHHRQHPQRHVPDGVPAEGEAADRGRRVTRRCPPNAPPPATPNANNVNLVENIERLKLPVDRILPLHGRVVPLADLYTAARRQCRSKAPRQQRGARVPRRAPRFTLIVTA